MKGIYFEEKGLTLLKQRGITKSEFARRMGILRQNVVKSKFSTNNFKKIRIPQFSETRFGSFVGLFSCFYVYKQ